ncbi:MAG: UvrD-helicase domain-containing protein [Alicyclobacillaceae bacterium]|nr:UvrD-helicase domain-containing protein [Alicyclobacillaceae bacterium]
MTRTPTEEQWRAIVAGDGHVAVTAGAGSGKTWVLTERYAAMLRGRPSVPPPANGEAAVPSVEPCRPGNIVAITFTDAAAADMRRKIRERLRELAEAGEDHLRPLLDEVEGAPISTIHSYCASLIRQYPLEAEVDPDFSILDEQPAQMLLLEAAEEALAAALAEGEPGVARALTVYGRRSLISLILSLGRVLREEGKTGAGVWEKTEAALNRIRDRWPARKASLLSAARGFREVLDLVPPGKKSREKVAFFVAEWEKIEDECFRWDGFVDERREELVRRLEKELWSGPPSKEVRPVVETWKEAVAGVLADLLPADLPEVTRGVCRLWDRAEALYREKKRRLRGLDYTDLQVLACALLERPDIRSRWARDIRYVMVDEYQDTNRLQARLVEALIAEGARLFVVGDEKQSIYRFRGADVGVFTRTRERIAALGGLTVPLRHNFRTQAPILRLINRVFEPLMDGSGEDPAAVAFQELIPTRQEDTGAVEIHYIPAGGTEGRFAEAARVAGWIAEAVGTGRVTVHDPGGEAGRPARYGDIAVLFAATTHLPVYEAALQERGIPYRVVGSRNFFRRQEVLDLIHALRWIHDPADLPAMVGTLRSPLFGLSDEGLYLLAEAGALHRAAEAGFAPPVPSLSSWDRAAWSAAMERVARWRARSLHRSAGSLLEEIVDETGFIPTLLQTRGGHQRAANVRRFIDAAFEAEAAGRGLLPLFLTWVQWQLDEDVDEEEAQQPGEENAVTLMTVHKSKGLEFPVVLVPDLARRFRTPREGWCLDDEGALALKLPGMGDYGAGWYRQVREVERRRDREEEKRKFYVALTRARDYLVLFAARRAPSGQSPPPTVESAGSWFDWLIVSLADGDLQAAPERCAALPGVRWFTAVPAEGSITAAEDGGGVGDSKAGEGETAAPAARPAGPGGPPVLTEVRGEVEEAERRARAIAEMEGLEGGWDREEFIPRPDGPLGRPEIPTFSASQLLEYDTCPRRYYYHWQLRLPSWEAVEGEQSGAGMDGLWEPSAEERPAGGTWSPLVRGMVVHRVCERWTGEGSILERLEQVLDEFFLKPRDRELAAAELRDELLGYAESDLAALLREASAVWSEWPFYLRLQGTHRSWVIHGQVDKILRAGGRTIVVDFKTNRGTAEELRPWAEHYRLQVQLYAWAVSRSLAPVDAAYLYFTAPGAAWEVDVRPDTLEAVVREIDARLETLTQSRRIDAYPYTDDPALCRVCPYQPLCPGGRR